MPEWLFLEMNPPAMTRFLEASSTGLKITTNTFQNGVNAAIHDSSLHRKHINQVIRQCLHTEDQVPSHTTKSQLTYRLAGSDDVATTSHLVHQLAIYEKEPDAVNVTVNNYLVDGCVSEEEPLFYSILAEMRNEKGVVTATCGMGLFFFGYVLGEGRFLYLDDLYIEEEHRGMGAGKGIMERLALISLALNCGKFVWTALDWNTPALNFYKKIGAYEVLVPDH